MNEHSSKPPVKLVVIGAGPGGYAAALRARQLGADVTLIEKDKPGGTCLNRGCIPSKIMRKTADVARHIAESAHYGLRGGIGSFGVDMQELRRRQRTIVDGQIQGLLRHFRSSGIRYIQGTARLAQGDCVNVTQSSGEDACFRYDHLLIATGSLAHPLPGLQYDGERIISSDQALWTLKKPENLLVLGGGVVGCELAQVFHDLGVNVTLIEGLDRLLPLPGVDGEISKVYARCLKKQKLPFKTAQTLLGIRDDGHGRIATKIKPFSGASEKTLSALPDEASGNETVREELFDQILIAVGRAPAHLDLNLESFGVALDEKGWIVTDVHCRTHRENIWAVGDCLGPNRMMLAHVATAEAMAAVDTMLAPQPRSVDYRYVPSAIFTVPEIGTVGLTTEQAREFFPGSTSWDFHFRTLGKAQATGELDGLVRLVVSPEKKVLGGHIIGPAATTLIAEVALAVTHNLSVDEIAATIHAHPTFSEGIWECASAAAGRPLHG